MSSGTESSSAEEEFAVDEEQGSDEVSEEEEEEDGVAVVKTAAEGPRPFRCAQCNKAFHKASRLARHAVSHTKEVQF
jgi:hypothetical protein